MFQTIEVPETTLRRQVHEILEYTFYPLLCKLNLLFLLIRSNQHNVIRVVNHLDVLWRWSRFIEYITSRRRKISIALKQHSGTTLLVLPGKSKLLLVILANWYREKRISQVNMCMPGVKYCGKLNNGPSKMPKSQPWNLWIVYFTWQKEHC